MTRPLDRLLSTAEGESIRKGSPLIFVGIDTLLKGISVDVSELDADLNEHGRSKVLAAAAILYPEALNGLFSVLEGQQAAGRAADPIPPCLPLKVIEWSVVEFVSLLSRHRDQLRTAFGTDSVNNVCKQHKDLIRAVEEEATLLSQL